MFAAGGLARATINAAAENKSKVGGAATFFVFLYTAIFGGEPMFMTPLEAILMTYIVQQHGLPCLGSILPKSSPWRLELGVMLGAWSAGQSGTAGV
jgi:hypothetical protein